MDVVSESFGMRSDNLDTVYPATTDSPPPRPNMLHILISPVRRRIKMITLCLSPLDATTWLAYSV